MCACIPPRRYATSPLGDSNRIDPKRRWLVEDGALGLGLVAADVVERFGGGAAAGLRTLHEIKMGSDWTVNGTGNGNGNGNVNGMGMRKGMEMEMNMGMGIGMGMGWGCEWEQDGM